MTNAVSLESIVERCSQFSGWKLKVQYDPVEIRFWDPADTTNDHSSLLVLRKSKGMVIETYGRMRHWAITTAEESYIADLLLEQ